jgi:four helix bundle protein
MQSHRTLQAWQHANAVVNAVISMSFTSWRPQLSPVFSQLQRASLSAQINIAEGYAFGPSRTMNHHLQIAYGSAVETGDLLFVLSQNHLADELLARQAAESCIKSQQVIMGMLRRYGATNRKCRTLAPTSVDEAD